MSVRALYRFLSRTFQWEHSRHGRGFKNEDLVTYFNAKSWYSELMAPEDFDEVFSTNKYEKANTDLIMELERDGNSQYLN